MIFVLQSVSTTPKGSKGTAGRSAYDDSTLPLVDKSQGQFCSLSLFVLCFACLLAECATSVIKVKRRARSKGVNIFYLCAAFSLRSHKMGSPISWI